MTKYFFLFIASLLFTATTNSQTIEVLTKGTKTSLRGLSVVNDRVIWVSGSYGKVGRSIDSGKTWKWITVEGFEQKDFRDIEAWDENTAVIMGVGEPAVILKTKNAGESWKIVYENKTAGMFLDAMDFYNKKNGVVIGDPIRGKFFVATTTNAGESWTMLPEKDLPAVDSGEACFAASGTNIRAIGKRKFVFVSGGSRSRLFTKDKIIALPIIQGTNTTGANSIALNNNKINSNTVAIVVGGDFSKDSAVNKNCFISTDEGNTWVPPMIAPWGYRSCVEFIDRARLITCGTSGVDISKDAGIKWEFISNKSFHVCRRAKNGKAVFLAGADGTVAFLNWKY